MYAGESAATYIAMVVNVAWAQSLLHIALLLSLLHRCGAVQIWAPIYVTEHCYHMFTCGRGTASRATVVEVRTLYAVRCAGYCLCAALRCKGVI